MLRKGPALETTYWCKECTEAESKKGKKNLGVIYLCQKVQQHDSTAPANSETCSQIWHGLWRNGTSIPPGLQYRSRAPRGMARGIDEDNDEDDAEGQEEEEKVEVEEGGHEE